ncbi:YjjG family noncanonical pyrimidine nucleotidase [Pullulanibacillus pueri]|uniref:Noncanonical pyrimidine nucleotidase, YjjG family protein n=1 Tax=Pullulanibacillus pueri TaxID=1437324 RepID=A0A8J3ENM0_9BACL|nr:YjjG family noncanonical pyrimidine nucleotidase [Pullulanibacillus pueri]MBM7683379.1 YjjG family noncanonical pyrimidine nucleotidase [Pullulanibacillus pueri]GGH86545.1 noncanonical pyrimidine nucleotidase, YjjG family protein [Pullulanibacillus pueri]
MNMYKHIIFDLDDTILNFQEAQKVALKEIITRYKLPYTEETIACYKQINNTLWHQFEEGVISQNDIFTNRFSLFLKEFQIIEDGAQVEAFYREHLNEGHKTMPHAREALKALKQKGFKLYIGTNGVGVTQRKRLKDAHLENYFEALFVSDEMGVQKPHAAFFTYIFEALGTDQKENVLMVGDRLTSDVQGAVNAGIDSVWFNPENILPSFESPQSTYTISDLIELPDLLEKSS